MSEQARASVFRTAVMGSFRNEIAGRIERRPQHSRDFNLEAFFCCKISTDGPDSELYDAKRVLVNKAPEPAFDKALKAAGIPKPPK